MSSLLTKLAVDEAFLRVWNKDSASNVGYWRTNNENEDWEEFGSTLVRDIKWRMVGGKVGRLQYWVSCEKSKGW